VLSRDSDNGIYYFLKLKYACDINSNSLYSSSVVNSCPAKTVADLEWVSQTQESNIRHQWCDYTIYIDQTCHYKI